jgi:hypothetical protein
MHTAQLFIGEDLFKVMEVKDIRPDIRIPLPIARISWIDSHLENELLSHASITFLLFDLEGVMQDGSHEVLRYRYKGGS